MSWLRDRTWTTIWGIKNTKILGKKNLDQETNSTPLKTKIYVFSKEFSSYATWSSFQENIYCTLYKKWDFHRKESMIIDFDQKSPCKKFHKMAYRPLLDCHQIIFIGLGFSYPFNRSKTRSYLLLIRIWIDLNE